MLGIVHRVGPDGRIDPKPGHPGHGRRSVEPGKADRVRELPRPDECPDCGGRLLDFGTSSRTLRDCAPPRYVTIRLDSHEGWCPRCMNRETLQSVMETLSLRHKDPVGVLAEALKAYKPMHRPYP